MSLMIAMKTPSCIVAASDSCMTMTTTKQVPHPQVTAMSYAHHATKMVVFRERLVVTYCSDMFMTKTIPVSQFLYDLREKTPRNISVKQLANHILSEYKEKSNRETIFLVSGFSGVDGSIWRVYTSNDTVEECYSVNEFGAAYNGETSFVHPMFKAVANYANLSAKDAIDLVSCTMDCISCLSQFLASQSVGGDIDIYLMNRDKSMKSGWVRAGQAIPIYPYGYRKGEY